MRVAFSSRLARDTRDHKLVVLEILLGPSGAKKGGKATPLSSAQMTLARGSFDPFPKGEDHAACEEHHGQWVGRGCSLSRSGSLLPSSGTQRYCPLRSGFFTHTCFAALLSRFPTLAGLTSSCE